MTLAELRAAFRSRADDTLEPFLWPDSEITLYLNEAQKEACERAHLIEAETTVALVPGTERYTLGKDVLAVLHARTPSRVLARGEDRHRLRKDEFAETQRGTLWVRSPSVAETLTLTVSRLPVSMAADADTPEIHQRYHYRLLDWVMRCAYLKQDTEAFDAKTATFHESLFELSFGKRPDANVQRKQREVRPFVVRYAGL